MVSDAKNQFNPDVITGQHPAGPIRELNEKNWGGYQLEKDGSLGVTVPRL